MPTASRAPTSVAAHIAPVRDGVLVVRLMGLITAASLRQIKADVMATMTPDARALILDYTGAAVVIDGAALDAVMLDGAAGGAAAMPAAMLVQSACIDLFVGHARRMVAARHVRRVFVEPGHALAWARHQALQSAG